MNERVAQRLSRILVLVLVGLAVGCSSERQGSAPTDDVETGGDAAVLADGSQSDAQADAEADTAAPVVCKQVTTWQPGTPVFVEATAEWGLTGVEGTRLSVVDYDSDGLPDVLIRRNAGPDDFAKDGKRNRWLLRSTGTGFVDVTAASKLLKARKSGTNGALKGVVFAAGDVDNDGDDDIFLARASDKPGDATDGETSELLLNNGDGTYSIGPDSAARMAKLATSPASVTFVDVDRDGNLDLWMTHNAPAGGQSPMQDRLFKGDGKGGFVDITVASGLTTKPWKLLADLNEAKAHSRAWSSAACDLNNDGWPELLASSYGRAPNHLWQAKSSAGKISYSNVSVASGYAFDGKQDWTTNINAQCYCLENPKAADCAKAAAKANAQQCAQLKAGFGGKFRWNHTYDRQPFRLGGSSGATLCSDINNDGHLDLLTTEIVHWDVGDTSDASELLINQKTANISLSRPGNNKTGLTRTHVVSGWNDGDMTAAILDFDNDGWSDIYIGNSDYPGNRGLLYRQTAPLKFQELKTADFFEHNRSHGVVAADFDGDGDMDLLVGHSRSRCYDKAPHDCYKTMQVRLFLNQIGSKRNWLQLKLAGGEGSNRSAIGARVEVTAGGVTQTQEVDGGHGHYNTQRDKLLHFGLGKDCTATVTITWPNQARTQQTVKLVGNQRWVVKQGQAPVVWVYGGGK